MSGVDLPDGRRIRKGAPDAVMHYVEHERGTVPPNLQSQVDSVAARGATPLLVCDANRIAGMIVLEDVLKPGMKDRFQRLRQMGLRTVMITGDNPLTAAAIAAAAGVDDFLAQATPEAKLAYIRKEQAEGKLVAMMGDGTNDAPALAQADVGVAMNSGTQAAKEAGNMVDLDSDPTKLIETVEIGKQLLMTRERLTTFSIANDLAKYFAIVPALFAANLPWLKSIDIMGLHSADLGNPLGGDLQCRHHSAIDSDRAAGRAVSAHRGRRPLAAEPSHLGPRRGHRAFRGNQTDRHGLGHVSLGRSCLNHVRSRPRHLWLLFSQCLGCVLYPFVLLAIGQTVFHDKAQGSMLTDREGKTVGSGLIAQPFSDSKLLCPAAVGGVVQRRCLRCIQLEREQPRLACPRRRATRPGPEISRRTARRTRRGGLVSRRADRQGPLARGKMVARPLGIAGVWAGSDDKVGAFLQAWEKSHAAEVEKWKTANPEATEVKPADLATLFFDSYAKGETTAWPEVDDAKDIRSGFFGAWWNEHPGAKVQPVPAEDMVMTSGSGLDPHITLANALYQLDGVAAAGAKEHQERCGRGSRSGQGDCAGACPCAALRPGRRTASQRPASQPGPPKSSATGDLGRRRCRPVH